MMKHKNKTPLKNKTGYTGVSYRSKTGKYYAKIRVNHECIYIGTYLTADEAQEAYMRRFVEIFGHYPRKYYHNHVLMEMHSMENMDEK